MVAEAGERAKGEVAGGEGRGRSLTSLRPFAGLHGASAIHLGDDD